MIETPLAFQASGHKIYTYICIYNAFITKRKIPCLVTVTLGEEWINKMHSLNCLISIQDQGDYNIIDGY